MSNVVSVRPEGRDRFSEWTPQTPVTDELGRIDRVLRDALPADAEVSFAFDGKLQVHIDVRKREDVILIEKLLPQRAGHLLERLTRSATPQRPFLHRISAIVNG
jgi:hypothetical protein